mmetsp:Transcript_15311/g.24921  ORF Transcript_15311/g.24921 Transcript_15311/m.24921 type:complete len:361 (-) Transcript_15311:633-1715(-)
MSAEVVQIVHSKNLVLASDAVPAHRCAAEVVESFWATGAPRGGGRNDMVMELVSACGLLEKVTVVEPQGPASIQDICEFHDRDYVNALCEWGDATETELEEYNLVDDSAPFAHVDKHAAWIAAGSLCAARLLVKESARVAINWCGGRHHAHRARASGFCYVNDVVLATLELQKRFRKIMCVDIDVHHGDGTEKAFYYTDKVLTMSFHQYGPGFFPGTGSSLDIGKGKGKGMNVNVPFSYGCDGVRYVEKFREVVSEKSKEFQPDAIVLVCGVDALRGDPRGGLKLDKVHICSCVSMLRDLGKPLLALGGGGYNFPDAAKCWTAVTATLLGQDIESLVDIPEHTYYELYGPSWKFNFESAG